ncbi:hypothetical protein D3C71_1741720 [compost metagenome]
MDRTPRPRPVEVRSAALGVEEDSNLPLRPALQHEHPVDTLDKVDLRLGPRRQHHPIGLQALVFASRQQSLGAALFVDQLPAQAKAGRAALPVAQVDEAALAGEDLGR